MIRSPLSASAGTIILSVGLIIFLISLAAAGFVWYRLHGGMPVLPTADSSPSPSSRAASPDVLSPEVVIDKELSTEKSALQTNLVAPLRLYFATRNERLTSITVVAFDDEKYQAKVSLTIAQANNSERTADFLYDLSPWQANMLDNHVPAE